MNLKLIKLIAALFVSLILTNNIILASDKEVPAIPVKFRADIFSHQNKNYLALSYFNAPHWHTYWKNPGDAGLPTKYTFTVGGNEVQISEVEWQAPQKFIEAGDMLAYGHIDNFSFFFELDQKQLKDWENQNLKINSKWLVCKHICVPGQAEVSGIIKNGQYAQSAQSDFSVDQKELIKRLEKLPKKTPFPSNLDLVLAKGSKENELVLYYTYTGTGGPISFDPQKQNLLIPYPLSPLDFKREEIKQDSKGQMYGRFPITWDGEYSEPPQPFPADGKFSSPKTLKFLYYHPLSNEISIIEKEFATFDLSNQKFETFFNSLSNNSSQAPTLKSEQEDNQNSFFYYLAMAFLGGLILNIMPCVLPVISLKLFSIIEYQNHSKKQIFKHNAFYTLGVLLTFWALAGVVLFLKTTGESVGWGFQLQSPYFVAVMIIILFVFSLNLFGLFEFRLPGSNKIASLRGGDGPFGHIFEGVLATVLSTPCSAPFLGTALTFAFTSGTVGILLIFTVVGIGLAFPFILTAFFPAAIRVLPKPGNWMLKLKKFLGMTLILTTLWLLDVFNALVDGTRPSIILMTVLALTFFAVYFAAKLAKKTSMKLLAGLFPLLMFINLMTSPLISQTSSDHESPLMQDKRSYGLDWEEWSVELMQKYQSEGQLVFIDFTAKWCFTCKVNEKLVLDTDQFRNLVKEKKPKLLLADWTKRDEKIGSWLESQGLVGVPAYFVINSKKELVKLGETISIGEIREQLK